MIRLNSQARPFTDFFSEDPAFEQPPDAPNKDATDEQVAAYKSALEAYLLKRRHAEETGDWSALRVQGSSEPTRFTVRLIPPDALGKLGDMSAAGTGENELATLAFRLALIDCNIEGVAVRRVDDDKFGKLADISWLADAGGTGVRLMREIGWRVFVKSSAVRPFS
jgi:hypothetical protein